MSQSKLLHDARWPARVKFDPNSREHMIAYLALVEHGRQHPNIRFELEFPYLDIKSMMEAKIARAYANRFNNIDASVKQLLSNDHQTVSLDEQPNVRTLRIR